MQCSEILQSWHNGGSCNFLASKKSKNRQIRLILAKKWLFSLRAILEFGLDVQNTHETMPRYALTIIHSKKVGLGHLPSLVQHNLDPIMRYFPYISIFCVLPACKTMPKNMGSRWNFSWDFWIMKLEGWTCKKI